MRKIRSFTGVRADGYHADVDGELDWQTFDQEFTDCSIPHRLLTYEVTK